MSREKDEPESGSASTLSMVNVRRAAELYGELDAAKEKVKELSQQHDAACAAALQDLVAAGVPSIPVEVGKERFTVYVRTLASAKAKPGVDKAQVADVLKRCGLSNMVEENFNWNTLSAWVRERLEGKKDLPPTLDSVIEVKHHSEACVRRAAASTSASKAALAHLKS